MKKLILILFFTFLLISCKNETKIDTPEKLDIPDSKPKVNDKNNFIPIPQKINFQNFELPELELPELELREFKVAVVPQPTPKNGFSPYDKYFGKGIYNNNSGNSFVIKNSNKTDAVVLLVDAYSGKKIRNEFVRKGTTFEMTGVPNGTYYLEWFSGTDWYSDLKVVSKFKGGFQTEFSFTKTKDTSDWMKADGYLEWTVTLYSVVGGDVESESIDANDFFN